MKKKCLFVYSLLITMALSLSSCGSQATESTTGTTSTTVETISTPEPTATPTPAPTVTPTSTPTPEPTPTVTPAPKASDNSDKSVDEIAAEESYTLSEQEKADLRALGATEEQINNVKSGQDFVDLVYSLVDSGSSTGNSSSGSNNNSNSSDNNGNDNDLPTAQLPADDGSLHGSMGSVESESDPWGDIPATPLGSGDTVQGSM